MKAVENSERREVRLASGTLELEVHRADLPLDALAGFADRYNARRGFLFVSKVLGKHYPVRPSMMLRVHRALAAKLDPAMPGPVVFIALAETAVGLGQSVYEQFRAATGRDDTLFLHSTRYRLAAAESFGFEEAHSHAPRHFVHVPPVAEGAEARIFATARSLVLIDDEITTGNTFAALAEAYLARNRAVTELALVSITDWLGLEGRQRLRSRLSAMRVSFADLLEGVYRFEGAGLSPAAEIHETRGTDPKDRWLRANFGRLGVCELPATPELLQTRAGEKTLVLGTGEFLYLPFKLALALEEQGHDVIFQSTTRSPIQLGLDILAKLELRDNYFENIPNYLYNVTPGQYDRVIICYETSELPLEHHLPEMLAAETRFFA